MGGGSGGWRGGCVESRASRVGEDEKEGSVKGGKMLLCLGWKSLNIIFVLKRQS